MLLIPVCAIILIAACSTTTTESQPTPTAPSPGPAAATVTAKVVAVLDGATIDVEIAGEVVRVRYLGIDVPGSGAGVDSDIFARALEFNRFRVMGRDVELERDGVDKDDSGRLLRYVYVDGEMVNVAMLEGGYAVVAGFPAEFAHRNSFTQAEGAAKRDGRGYWHELDESHVLPDDLVDDTSTPAPPTTPRFLGGTLPLPPGSDGGGCDFTGTRKAVIKGNVDSDSGERTYIQPGSIFYSTTVVDFEDGDAWICTEADAIAAGWTKAKH